MTRDLLNQRGAGAPCPRFRIGTSPCGLSVASHSCTARSHAGVQRSTDESLPAPVAALAVDVRARHAGSAGGCKELEGDAIGISKAQSGAVRRVLDLAMSDAELVETRRPLLELLAVRTSERDVVEPHSELAERLLRCRRLVLVQPDERVAEQIDGVMHVWVGVLVDDRFGVEECSVPWRAHRQVANG